MFRVRLFLSLLTTVVAGAPAFGQTLVSETLRWQARSGVRPEHCESCKKIPVTVRGPAIVTVRLQMEPFQLREYPTYFNEIVTSNLGEMAQAISTTVNGSNTYPGAQQLVGKPVDKVVRWRLTESRVYNFTLDMKSPIKCSAAWCEQRAAGAQLTVSLGTEAAAPTAAPAPASSRGSGFADRWTRTINGVVVDILNLSAKGEGFVLELRGGEGKPPYASGFCMPAGDRLICAVRDTRPEHSGLFVLQSRGTTLTFHSWKMDGTRAGSYEFLRAR